MNDLADTYTQIYREDSDYRMRNWRRVAVSHYLKTNPVPASVLDIGCGRGETRNLCLQAGTQRWRGCEIVPDLCGPDIDLLSDGAHRLPYPDDAFASTWCLDVLEHLRPDDVRTALREMLRTAPTAFVSIPCKQDNRGLHLTVQPRDWWEKEFSRAGWSTWRILDLPTPEVKQPHFFAELQR